MPADFAKLRIPSEVEIVRAKDHFNICNFSKVQLDTELEDLMNGMNACAAMSSWEWNCPGKLLAFSCLRRMRI